MKSKIITKYAKNLIAGDRVKSYNTDKPNIVHHISKGKFILICFENGNYMNVIPNHELEIEIIESKPEPVSAKQFIGMLLANIDNEKLTDAKFRQFIRNTLPILEKPNEKEIFSSQIIEKYY